MKDASKAQGLRICKALIALVMVLGMVFAQAPTTAYAKSLKASGVKFTKKNKTVKSKMWYGGVGKQKMTYKLSGLKIKDAKKKGYKQATFTLTYKLKWKPNDDQVFALKDSRTDEGIPYGGLWAFIVDYRTGDNLECPALAKKHGVTVKTGEWKRTSKDFAGSKISGGGSGGIGYGAVQATSVNLYTKWKIKITVTYPKGYDGLCIGMGTGQKKYNGKQMAKWNNGKVKYAKCWWNKNNKATTRFVRIR
jgi:hypothetical protein